MYNDKTISQISRKLFLNRKYIMFIIFCLILSIHTYCQTTNVGKEYIENFQENYKKLINISNANYTHFNDFVIIMEPYLAELTSISVLNQEDVERLIRLNEKIFDKYITVDPNAKRRVRNKDRSYDFKIDPTGHFSSISEVIDYITISSKIYTSLNNENERLANEARKEQERIAARNSQIADSLRYVAAEQEKISIKQKEQNESQTEENQNNENETSTKINENQHLKQKSTQPDKLTIFLIVTAVLFILLLILAAKEKVVVYSGWRDLFGTSVMLSLPIIILFVFDNEKYASTVAIFTFVAAVLITIIISIKQNGSFFKGLFVGMLKVLFTLLLVILLFISAIAAGNARTEYAKTKEHLKNKDLKKAAETLANAKDNAAIAAGLSVLCSAFIYILIRKKIK